MTPADAKALVGSRTPCAVCTSAPTPTPASVGRTCRFGAFANSTRGNPPDETENLRAHLLTGAKLRLQPMGFDDAGNQLWRQLKA
ncbi:hypothetical protein PBI_DLANE_76 [Mycobacterium phage DLane]|uniref:Uncharacterized protein n=1 Tax=Mycobacterium phage DLane TaxID=2922203 RepID=G1D1H0_9CAUD|nr:hypothetical protein FGG21_gp076 [Mycobacterium phage DLane]AEK08620.1 hypothetical protein PBI_DLANE_76 [Mycobacterium phage DLane]